MAAFLDPKRFKYLDEEETTYVELVQLLRSKRSKIPNSANSSIVPKEPMEVLDDDFDIFAKESGRIIYFVLSEIMKLINLFHYRFNRIY
jgi:hypothetical protein